MAFQLSRHNSGIWTGAVGATVTIDVRSEKPASVVRIVYGGREDGESPYEFDIRSGQASLLVFALGIKNGQEVEIHEVDGENSQVLKSFFWSKQNFFDFIVVQGD